MSRYLSEGKRGSAVALLEQSNSRSVPGLSLHSGILLFPGAPMGTYQRLPA